MKKNSLLSLLLLPLLTLPLPCFAKDKLAPVRHIIVVYLENHSFDNLFGTFPGADGLANRINLQTQEDNTPYVSLPPVTEKGMQDKRFPSDLPNAPFLITRYVPYNKLIPDMVHRFYQIQQQIHGGAMDKFVQHSTAGGMVMGYYEEKESPLWRYAAQYTLADHFFTAAFGGSLFNHFWLICACTPHYDKPPPELLAQVDEHGALLKDAPLTPEGYAVNNIEPFSAPYNILKAPRQEQRLPAQTLPTIGDRLSEKHISWAWYSGGWNSALKGEKSSFIPHHLPFLYFQNYGEGTAARSEHLKDEEDLLQAIKAGTLPEVVFYKPAGQYDLHPGYSTPQESEEHVFSIIKSIEESIAWKDSLIIVTFDDSGGFYDHVSPPKRDRFGPGVRIPTLIISPFAKRGYIDHTTYDTTAILALIEKKFGLPPLNEAYKQAGDLTQALQ